MVEVLIVIGIIVLLAGLTVTVGTGMLRKSKVNETEQILRMLDQAVTEWEVSKLLKCYGFLKISPRPMQYFN